MEWASELTRVVQDLLNHYGLLGIALVLFIEECGVPSPIRGDVLLLTLGHEIDVCRVHPILAVATAELVAVCGASVLYFLSRRAGRPFLYRYSQLFHLDLARLDQAEQSLQQHGPLAVAAGRLIPGLRIVTAIAG